MRHLHSSNVFHKIIQWHGLYAKNILFFGCPSQKLYMPCFDFHVKPENEFKIYSCLRKMGLFFLLKGNDFQVP